LEKLFGLIGFPLSHSFSKKYFEEKFTKDNLNDCKYNLYPLESLELFPTLISNNLSLKGLNVTIPYKETIIPYLTTLDETAKQVGAVNCIKINQLPDYTHELIGYNTDVFGFRQSIKPFLESKHNRALILGTGGSAKAVEYVLKEIGIDCYFITRNKTKESVQNSFSYDELNENIISAFKLIINATPVGMFPNVNIAPDLPYQYITKEHLLYDLIYNPAETEFIKQGKLKGASTVNGLSMLYQQAEESWRIWNRK